MSGGESLCHLIPVLCRPCPSLTRHVWSFVPGSAITPDPTYVSIVKALNAVLSVLKKKTFNTETTENGIVLRCCSRS